MVVMRQYIMQCFGYISYAEADRQSLSASAYEIQPKTLQNLSVCLCIRDTPKHCTIYCRITTIQRSNFTDFLQV
jgi:hypothetical protein